MFQFKTLQIYISLIVILFAYQNCSGDLSEDQRVAFNSIQTESQIDKKILANGPVFFSFKNSISIRSNISTQFSSNPALEHQERFSFEWRRVLDENMSTYSEVISSEAKLEVINDNVTLDSSYLGLYVLSVFYKDKVNPIIRKTLKVVELPVEYGIFQPIFVSEATKLAHNLNGEYFPILGNLYSASYLTSTPGYNTYKELELCDNLIEANETPDSGGLFASYDIFEDKRCSTNSIGKPCKSKSVRSSFIYNTSLGFLAYTCEAL